MTKVGYLEPLRLPGGVVVVGENASPWYEGRMPVSVRRAAPADIPTILSLLRELAEFEGRLDRVQVNETRLAEYAFGERACIEILIGNLDGQDVSYALFFPIFGSFRGLPWLYLEDLYVQPRARGANVGRSMMSSLARVVKERGWAGMAWGVLEWNEAAFRFYERLGAVRSNHGHVGMELAGGALDRIADLQ
ncbi:MAG: GNAT family N-acetyltransferase [Candidatus Solibacter sp.]